MNHLYHSFPFSVFSADILFASSPISMFSLDQNPSSPKTTLTTKPPNHHCVANRHNPTKSTQSKKSHSQQIQRTITRSSPLFFASATHQHPLAPARSCRLEPTRSSRRFSSLGTRTTVAPFSMRWHVSQHPHAAEPTPVRASARAACIHPRRPPHPRVPPLLASPATPTHAAPARAPVTLTRQSLRPVAQGGNPSFGYHIAILGEVTLHSVPPNILTLCSFLHYFTY